MILLKRDIPLKNNQANHKSSFKPLSKGNARINCKYLNQIELKNNFYN